MTNELRSIDDESVDGIFGLPHTKPIPPTKDKIYMTKEVKVESLSAKDFSSYDHEIRPRTSTDTAVEYADATIFARRSDIVPSVFKAGGVDSLPNSRVVRSTNETQHNLVDQMVSPQTAPSATTTDIFHVGESYPALPAWDSRPNNLRSAATRF